MRYLPIEILLYKEISTKQWPMLKFLVVIILGSLILLGCINHPSNKSDDKALLLQLEYKWFEAEFSADTVFLSSLLDSTFICLTEGGVLTKQETLNHMITNRDFRTKNKIVIDSVRLENVIIHQYENSAVVTFIDHTYAKKGETALESKTPFYDVWIRRGNEWKAVSSQAHY